MKRCFFLKGQFCFGTSVLLKSYSSNDKRQLLICFSFLLLPLNSCLDGLSFCVKKGANLKVLRVKVMYSLRW